MCVEPVIVEATPVIFSWAALVLVSGRRLPHWHTLLVRYRPGVLPAAPAWHRKGQYVVLPASITRHFSASGQARNRRQRQRGYNHASLLARVCSTQLGVPLYENILVRHRATLAQVDLNPKDRHQNVAGTFHCTPAFATGTLCGRRIVIIDDVCTTCATLEACAMPLFAAGAERVWGLVLARPVA